MKIEKYFNSEYLKVSLFFISTIFFSCSNEEILPEAADGDPTPIRIGSKIVSALGTRAYQASGQINDGQYYLTYTAASTNNEQVATVNFGNPASPSTGIVTTPDNDELQWKMVGGTGDPLLFLDNVKGTYEQGAVPMNTTTVAFSNEYNPFVAAPFDSVGGTNDLLWGSQTARRGSAKVNFSLNHNMSRVRVIVTADATNEILGGEVGLDEGATVTLTDIATTPLSFNRLDGSLSLVANPETDSPATENLQLLNNTGEGEQINWINSYYPDPDNQNIKTFITADFVLPPQTLPDKEDRPKLVITTKGGKTFSGIIPHAMQVEYDDPATPPYPVALAFLKQHILTIETMITQDPPELVFMPVKVIDWVDRGEWTLEGHQAGVYLASDFMDLLKYYQEKNVYQLVRYGVINKEVNPDGSETANWIFNFWRSVTLNFTDIANKMPLSGLPEGMDSFSFQFYGFGQSVRMANGNVVNVSAQQLYNIVTKGTLE